MLERVAALTSELREPAKALMKAFWPGPLTILLPRTVEVPDAVTAGRPLVGVRMPAHPVARELIRRAALPIAAPSANLFGKPSPTTAAHVLADLDGRIDAVLDGEPTAVGVESTVLDLGARAIYRPGAVTAEMISRIIGDEVRVVSWRDRIRRRLLKVCLLPVWGCGTTLRRRGWCWSTGSRSYWRRSTSIWARRLG